MLFGRSWAVLVLFLVFSREFPFRVRERNAMTFMVRESLPADA